MSKALLFVFVLIATGACKKKEEIKISEDDFTQCPEMTVCNYDFIENADLGAGSVIEKGQYRLFSFSQKDISSCVIVRQLHIKYFMGLSEFYLDTDDIKNNKIAYSETCGCCNTASLKPVDGYVKAERITAQKWLIDAEIYLATGFGEKPVRTIKVKQYFYQNWIK